jgi:hypothetical protein
MHLRHWLEKKILVLSMSLVCVISMAGILAWPLPFQDTATAAVRSMGSYELDALAHSLDLHWVGHADQSPDIVDFGGATQDESIAGMGQWFARHGDYVIEAAADVLGPKRVMVLRVYFNDYPANTRYTKTQVEGFFGELDQLWKDTSYNKINIVSQVSDLYILPDNRSLYVDDFDDGDLSNDSKFWKVLDDAIDNAPAGLDWSNLDAIMVVMAETSASQFHRGQATGGCNLRQGPGGSLKSVGCAIFSENPSETDRQVWGRWAHEIGHAFQQGGPAHPSNYLSEFELMDSNYPGQTGVFSKQAHGGFPGWMPPNKYVEVSPAKDGGFFCLWAMEYDPLGKPNPQAIKAKITDTLYYMVSVRRRVLGDDLNGDFANGIPDEGVLIERVVEGADPWVTLQAPPGLDRNSLWKAGQTFTHAADGISIIIDQEFDEDNYCITIRYTNNANQPDVGMHPWTSPPGNTWETTDIWVDSPVNGFGTYRYGFWNDLWGNPVPRGNGDDPAVGMVNRLYARVRNVGTAPATDVKVTWEITDPPGVGIAGANGWAAIGSVDKNQFPALVSIAPGAYVDVYVEWTPNILLTPEQISDGRFYFHTCVRVKIAPVSGETALANQDGDREQENINYFQAVIDEGGDTATFDGVVRLRNDDLVNSKVFYISHEIHPDIADRWIVNVNNGIRSVELAPNELREIPVVIKPQGPAVVGSSFYVDVSASSLRPLVNDLNPKDVHHEFKPLGGVRVEALVLLPAQVECKATSQGEVMEVMVEGILKGGEKYYQPNSPYRVLIQGVDASRRFIPEAQQVAYVEKDGGFNGVVYSRQERIAEVICLFAGTTELTTASSGYIPVANEGPAPQPSPTRTPMATWTPIPSVPTPGPMPTPTSQFVFYPYQPIKIIDSSPLLQGDLSLHGIEITQGIQCFDTSKGLTNCPDNSLPVVTNKSTAARVYIKFNHAFLTQRSNVPVRLFMRRDGGAWQSMNATGKGLPSIDQSEAANSANFFFNINGNSPVVVDFYAIVDPDNVISENNEGNNRYPSSGHITMTFRPRDNLKIVGQRLRWDPSGPDGPWTAGNGSGSGTSGWTVNSGAALWFNQLLPLRNGGVNYSVASGTRNWTGSLDNNNQHDLIKQMNGEYALALIFNLLFGGNPNNLPDHIYGWIPHNRGSFGHADMPVYPHAGGLGVVGIGTSDPGTSTDNPGPGVLIFGHELVHNYDVKHTNTADGCGSGDSSTDFPYGSSSIQEYGFNPLTQKVYRPENTHDLMSYCPAGGSREGWISPFTWNRMFNKLNVAAVAASADGEVIELGRSGSARLLRTNHASSLVVNATIFNPAVSDQKGGRLGNLYKVGQGYQLILPEGDYRVELRSKSSVLVSRTFQVSFESEYTAHDGHDGHDGDPHPLAQADVSFVMPFVEGTTSVALLHKGNLLDERAVSNNVPQVTITSPAQVVEWKSGEQTLSWTGSDADGDSLVYAVLYSYDGGINWQMLQEGLTQSSFTVDVDALAGSSDARFRVIASDGIHSNYAETKEAIVVPNKKPMPVILEPAHGISVEPNTLVVLQGGAADLEDGSLPAGQLRWFSNRQGELGVGYSVPIANLVTGQHVITLLATDSYGIIDETSITIHVGHTLYLPSLQK